MKNGVKQENDLWTRRRLGMYYCNDVFVIGINQRDNNVIIINDGFGT